MSVDIGSNINFGHIVNGSVMEFSTQFGYSGWTKTGPGPGLGKHNWYDKIDLYINSHGFRCDEFVEKDKHDGMHLLFAGCSVTWGDATKSKDLWAKKVYDKISSVHKTSGYFNIGFPGMSIIQEIFWIIKYCKAFGNPDFIFFLMPNVGRFVNVGYIGGGDSPVLGSSLMDTESKDFDTNSLLLAAYLTFEAYLMLDEYCKASGITLISSTWSDHPNERINHGNSFINPTASLLKGKFDTFFDFMQDGVDKLEWMYEYIVKNPEATLRAIDDIHPGSAEHAYFATRMLDRYREITNEDIRL
jgi:hypothetical protein